VPFPNVATPTANSATSRLRFADANPGTWALCPEVHAVMPTTRASPRAYFECLNKSWPF